MQKSALKIKSKAVGASFSCLYTLGLIAQHKDDSLQWMFDIFY